MDTNETWDVIVVGGGAAGLSAALVLGRALQRTLVVDAGEQSNRPAHGVGGLLGHDGRPPAELYALGHEELAAYPSVEVRAGTVVAGEQREGGFVLTLADGTSVQGRRVVLALGMDYRRPELPGIEERWGRSVFHCPFCHGWEVHGRPLGVLDRGAAGVHRALLLRTWSDDVTLLTDGPAGLTPEELATLAAAAVGVDERPVARLLGEGDALRAVQLTDGAERACEGLLVPVVLHQRSDLASQLGATAAEPTPLAADGLVVDAWCRTDVPALYAPGDLAGEMPSVVNAVAAGSKAAAAIVQDQVAERLPAA